MSNEEIGVQLAAARAGRAYIAGPMTGIDEFNFQAFNAEAARMRAEGWHVENPAEHGIVDGAEWADYMHYDLERLSTCSTIHLLPGWSNSKGARLEFHIAIALGMTISYAEGAEHETGPIPAQPDHFRGATKKTEPFGYFRPMLDGWEDCAETDEGAVALYDHPEQSLAAEHEEKARLAREIVRLRASLATAQTAVEVPSDDDSAYELGKRDGYEEAVQDIDIATGGDGEYRYCMDCDPDRHTPDAATMKQRIIDRFNATPAPAASPVVPAGVWQFFDRGEWHIGSNSHNHRKNTEEAGYPVRDLFAASIPSTVEKPRSSDDGGLTEADLIGGES